VGMVNGALNRVRDEFVDSERAGSEETGTP
jgi:hypothetical protein